MHYNRRTSALLAAGVISLAAITHAEEKATPIQTALSSTTISGYVDTSAQWNPGTGTGGNFYGYGGAAKSDGFNLNVVQLSIGKPLDESEWASGYKVDLWFGPDANTLGTASALPPGAAGTSDFTIKQAYVALRTPVGNGIDWKIGVFDTIIGYESSESPNNPNFTRSYGYTIEPTTHTGLLGTYKFSDEISASAGIANTFGPVVNQRAFQGSPGSTKAESYKTYMASVALTAPKDWGWAAGSTLSAGVINGFNGLSGLAVAPGNGPGNQTSWYVGATVATPVTGLKVGAAFDYLDSHASSGTLPPPGGTVGRDIWDVGAYASYQATEKLSFHARGEMFYSPTPVGVATTDNAQVWSLTATVQYDLWQNVLTRIEGRWDRGDEGAYFFSSHGGTISSRRNTFMLAANIVYKF